MDVAEKAIKILEKISEEFGDTLLKEGALEMLL